MKRLHPAIILFAVITSSFLITGFALAQQDPSADSWVDSGDDIITTNPGNVGIGTSTPTDKLHVNGQIRANSNVILDSSSSVPNDIWGGPYLINQKGGFIGHMGNHSLDLYWNGYRRIPDNKYNVLGINGSDTINAIRMYDTGIRFYSQDGMQNGDDAPAVRMFIGNDGNIGIGTTDPWDSHVKIYDGSLDTEADYQGLYVYTRKTSGLTDFNDHLNGIRSITEIDQTNTETGQICGIVGNVRLMNGSVGNATSGIRNMLGGHFQALTSGGTVTGNVYGSYSVGNIDNGTVSQSVYGSYSFVDVESDAIVGGNVYGGFFRVDCDSDPGGKAYGLYVDIDQNVDYGVYVEAGANNFFGGNVDIGTGNAGFIFKPTTAPSSDVGGSTLASIITTSGTSASSFHVGFEIPSNDANDGFFVSTDSNQDGTVDTVALKINANGFVGIGTTSPDNRLDVKGTIRAEEVKVETGWSDFIFNEDYVLPSLSEVESYIKDNKHLPDIPSAREVKQEGLAMSEMMTKQMQKIEELTLYLIQLEKKNAELEARLAAIEDKN